MIELSLDQKSCLDSLMSWYKSKDKSAFITLGGYAGTGKSTLISILRKKLAEDNKDLKVAFVSFTGKATRVLKSKLEESNTILNQDSVSTIHSLIYSPITNAKEEIVGWERRNEVKYDLIIVDEASMVDSEIWNDLVSYHIPIIAVGDHGQLPPIKGSFNLMQKPDLKLEEIHRQEKDNPIIKLSILAREQGNIPYDHFGGNVMKLNRQDHDTHEIVTEVLNSFNSETLVLCGYNTTRVKLNQYIRQTQEFFTPDPQPKDRVICLRNNHAKGIYNGMLGTVLSISHDDDEWYNAEIKMDGEKELFKGLISQTQFNNKESLNFTEKRSRIMIGDLFDFGYALTVHKAQGSQSKRVVLFEERFAKMDDETWRRWLYTGVTRAEEELFIIG